MADNYTDQFAALLDGIKAGDPRYIEYAKQLDPHTQQAFFDYQQGVNKGKGEVGRADNQVLGMPPELIAAGGAKALQMGVSALPSLGSQAKAFGKAALLGKAFQSLGLPPWMALAIMKEGGIGAMLGAGADEEPIVAEKKVSTRTMPMSDAEYEAATGHPRGAQTLGANKMPNGGPTQPTKPSTLGGPDTANLREQPNVSVWRTAGDVGERVKGGVQVDQTVPPDKKLDFSNPEFDNPATPPKGKFSLKGPSVAERDKGMVMPPERGGDMKDIYDRVLGGGAGIEGVTPRDKVPGRRSAPPATANDRGPSARGQVKVRALSSNEEDGVKQLGELIDALHGSDAPTQGNGTMPTLPAAPESSLRSTRRRRP